MTMAPPARVSGVDGIGEATPRAQPAAVGTVERTPVWRCIGCGRIEADANCVGICEDRRVEVVDARDFDALSHELDAVRCSSRELLAFVRQVALTTPRSGEWERCQRALQERARRLVAAIGPTA
ncbi:MAG: hypothetical protein GC151_18565 [Betaproteobacteria bacterium]|nr:hypothetical protein [Betaproteobacteria bacterium]